MQGFGVQGLVVLVVMCLSAALPRQVRIRGTVATASERLLDIQPHLVVSFRAFYVGQWEMLPQDSRYLNETASNL